MNTKLLNTSGVNVREVLGRVFGMPAESLSDTDSSDTISNWDSFQTLIMFQELEAAAHVLFDLNDLKQICTVGDIKKLLEKYNVPSL